MSEFSSLTLLLKWTEFKCKYHHHKCWCNGTKRLHPAITNICYYILLLSMYSELKSLTWVFTEAHANHFQLYWPVSGLCCRCQQKKVCDPSDSLLTNWFPGYIAVSQFSNFSKIFLLIDWRVDVIIQIFFFCLRWWIQLHDFQIHCTWGRIEGSLRVIHVLFVFAENTGSYAQL